MSAALNGAISAFNLQCMQAMPQPFTKILLLRQIPLFGNKKRVNGIKIYVLQRVVFQLIAKA